MEIMKFYILETFMPFVFRGGKIRFLVSILDGIANGHPFSHPRQCGEISGSNCTQIELWDTGVLSKLLMIFHSVDRVLYNILKVLSFLALP